MSFGLILIVFVVLLPLYLLPSIVGAARKISNIGVVIVLNVLLGWTLIGWVIALVMAVSATPSPA